MAGNRNDRQNRRLGSPERRQDAFNKYELVKRSVNQCLGEQGMDSSAVLNKWFRGARWDVRLLFEQYGFGNRKVLDIGCAYGSSLFMWGDDSEGVELHEECVVFLEAMGRRTHRFNVEDEGWNSIPENSFEAVFSSNLVEHLIAPHLFLANLYRVLREGGILALQHPVVVPSPASGAARMVPQLGRILGREGWYAGEHINFFTPRTIGLTLERAGFEVLAQYGGYFRKFPTLGRWITPLATKCLSVCRKSDAYVYSGKRIDAFDPAWARELVCQYRDRAAVPVPVGRE